MVAERKTQYNRTYTRKLVIIIMAGNTIPATTQMIQLTSQLFVERLNPKYIAVAINQYALEIAVLTSVCLYQRKIREKLYKFLLKILFYSIIYT